MCPRSPILCWLVSRHWKTANSSLALPVSKVEKVCKAAGRKVNTVVNYNAFKVNDQLMSDYIKMGADVIKTHYRKVARFTTNRDDNARFTDEFGTRRLPANLFASEEEAVRFVLE